LRSAFTNIAQEARKRASEIEDIVTLMDEPLDAINGEILTTSIVGRAMDPVLSKLTSVYVLAADLGKADLELFSGEDDVVSIEELEPLVAWADTRSDVENSIVGALVDGLDAIADAGINESPESLAFLLIDGVGIGEADAEEFVEHKGEGDEVLPLYEKFAEQMADHAITFVVNRAQEALWSGAVKEGILDSGKVSRLWICRLGCRSCIECSGMDGETAPINLAWKLPKGGTVVTPTEAHSDCHCTERLVRKEA
jgi:hypothetical protein